MLIAVPVGVGVALFITQYAPRWLRRPAAPPGRPARRGALDRLRPLGRLTSSARIVEPVQDVPRARCSAGSRCSHATGDQRGGTIFFIGIVLSIMVLPIVTALSREVFAQTPVDPQGGRARPRRHPVGDDPHRGAAVRPARRHPRLDARPRPRARRDHRRHDHPVRAAPTARRGRGRSSTAARRSPRKIANNAAEFDNPQKTGAYIAAGLVLFVLTFVVNAIARIVIERRKAFTE